MQVTASRLRTKLLIAHLLLSGVGIVAFALTVVLLAPGLFHDHSHRINDLGLSGPATQQAYTELQSAFQVSMMEAFAAATAAGVVAAIVAGLFVSERIAAPVRRMAEAARLVAAGNYTKRVGPDGPDPIYELKQLGDSFNEMAASLEANERRRSEMLGDLAHELRTPISTLAGYTEGLLDGMIEPSEETWALLNSEARRLSRLADDLRDLSKAEARSLSLKLEAVDPAVIASRALDPLRSQFAEMDICIDESIRPDLPRVCADQDRAVQVLTNLLTNALRYTTPPGKVTMKVKRFDAGREVVFEVADTGIGVDAGHLPRLFERFYRVDKSRSRAAGGSGIGLTVARELVGMMGGRIWAESAGMGQGSTFYFTLPVA